MGSTNKKGADSRSDAQRSDVNCASFDVVASDAAGSSPIQWRSYLAGKAILILEAFVLLGIAIIVDRFVVPGGLGSFSPNPLWALVLYSAMRHGTAHGVMVAMGSAFIHVSRAPATDVLTSDALGYFADIAHEPLLWLLLAAVVGEARRAALRREAALTAAVQRLERQDESLQSIVEVLEKELEDVTIERAAEADVALLAYDVMRNLGDVTLDNWTDWANELITELLGATQFSVYVLRDEELVLALRSGLEKDDEHVQRFSSSSALYKRIVNEPHDCASVLHEPDAEVLKGMGLIACPLTATAGDTVVGMLKVERMAFAELDTSYLARTRVAATWIGATLVNLQARQPVHAPGEESEGADLKQITFKRQLSFVQGLSQRVGFDVAVIVLTPTLADDLKASERIAVRNALREAIGGLRTSDWVVEASGEYDSAIVMLPKTTLAHAQTLARRIQTIAQQRLPESLRNVRVRAFVGPLSALSRGVSVDQQEPG